MNKESEKEWEVRPGGMLVQRRDGEDQCGPNSTIKIDVSHGPNHLDLHVSPLSTFGDVKKAIEEKTGLEAEQQTILFRGHEKEDGEYVREAGVRDKSKVMLLLNPAMKEKSRGEVGEGAGNLSAEAKESDEAGAVAVAGVSEDDMSKAFLAVAQVREEVDKLEERVGALEVAVTGGTKVADEEFVVSSELLMRQLLKLDNIEAEGEARLQRKAEVCRIQKFHETLDNLKAHNSKPFSNSTNAVSVTTEWETFDSGVGSLTSPPPMSSATRITEDWERFD